MSGYSTLNEGVGIALGNRVFLLKIKKPEKTSFQAYSKM
jgi:hypothetical protein